MQARKRMHAVCTAHNLVLAALAAVTSSTEHLKTRILQQAPQSRDLKAGSPKQETRSRTTDTSACGDGARLSPLPPEARSYLPCGTVTGIASVHLYPASLTLRLFSSWLGCACGVSVLTATVTACWAVHLQQDSRSRHKCCTNACQR